MGDFGKMRFFLRLFARIYGSFASQQPMRREKFHPQGRGMDVFSVGGERVPGCDLISQNCSSTTPLRITIEVDGLEFHSKNFGGCGAEKTDSRPVPDSN